MLDIDTLIKNTMHEVLSASTQEAKDVSKAKLKTYKLLKGKITEFKTAKRAKNYGESEEIKLIKGMIADRANSAEIYLKNDRKDLADIENQEIRILQDLLPPLPTREDIEMYLDVNYGGGIDKSVKGAVIKEIKTHLLGCDERTVVELVEQRII